MDIGHLVQASVSNTLSRAGLTMRKISLLSLLTFLLVNASGVSAQNVASVNGVQIPDAQFERALSGAVNQGQKDTPELRLAIKNELINRQLLAQAASKKGLDKSSEAQAQWAQIRENFLVDLYLTDYLKSHPITDADVRAEYDREVGVVKSSGSTSEYKVSIIVVPTEANAASVISQLKKGSSFAALAKENSIDQTKAQGGLVGWVLPAQVNPEIGAAIQKLNKGAFTTTPIQTQAGWNVLKVDDKKPFKIPEYAEVQNRIRQQLIQKQRIELIKSLRADAKISGDN